MFWPGLGVKRATFCLTHSGGVPSFHVSRSNATPLAGSEVAAYPEFLYGCVHGSCSPGSLLPQRVDKLQHVRVSTYYRLTRRSRGGKWDASFDIWFARHDRRTGQPTAAELMLWLVNRKVRYFPEWSIRVHGIKWLAEEWITHNRAGQSWPLVIFERAHPDGHVKRMPLRPFIHFAEKHGWIQSKLWMTSIASGFEIWSRGRGLGIRFFRIFHS